MAASDAPPCVVTQFHITRWTEKDPPQNPAALLDVVQEVNAVQMASGNKPIIVMCKWVCVCVMVRIKKTSIS